MKRILLLLALSTPTLSQTKCLEPNPDTFEDYLNLLERRAEALAQRQAAEREQQEREVKQEAAEEVLEAIKNLTLLPDLNANLRKTLLRNIWVKLNRYPDLLIHDVFLTEPLFSEQDQVLSYTPLMYALKKRNSELALLLSDFSNPAQPTDSYANLLDFIVRMDVSDLNEEEKDEFMTTVETILSKLIKPDSHLLEEYNRQGNTPLIQAILHPDPETAESLSSLLLMVLKASPDTPNAAGVAPLFVAINRGNDTIIANLTFSDADINITNSDGQTPSQLMPQEQKDRINKLLCQMEEETQKDSGIDTPEEESETN